MTILKIKKKFNYTSRNYKICYVKLKHQIKYGKKT